MFSVERINIIKQILLEKGRTDIASLTELLGVSDVTVRKDLDKLEGDGFLKKVHGGAILAEEGASPTADLTAQGIEMQHEKKMIADLAITLIQDGDNFFLGAGSTNLLLSKNFGQKKNLTVITNNASALPFIDPNTVNLNFIGGEILSYQGMIATYGKKALSYLDDMYISKAFISADNVDMEAGVTINPAYVFDFYKKVLERSRDIILLATTTKFGKTSLNRLCALDALTAVVSNGDLPDQYKDFFYKQNIKLLTSFNI